MENRALNRTEDAGGFTAKVNARTSERARAVTTWTALRFPMTSRVYPAAGDIMPYPEVVNRRFADYLESVESEEEREILKLFGEGRTDAEIGAALGIDEWDAGQIIAHHWAALREKVGGGR